MAVKSGQPTGVVALDAGASSDNTVSSAGADETREFYALVLHNTGGTSETVEVFISADTTSATAERIGYYSVDGNDQVRLNPISLNVSQHLLMKPSGTGCTVNGIYTSRTGSDK